MASVTGSIAAARPTTRSLTTSNATSTRSAAFKVPVVLGSTHVISSTNPLRSTFATTLKGTRRSAASTVIKVPRASLTIKESSTGIEFPLVQKFWLGEDSRTMGASVRAKKIAFIAVKVYAIALYVEAEKAARELGVRARGGFFESDDDYCSALVDGAFHKVLQIELARDVEGAQFVEALEEALRPRMSLSGELSVLESFSGFFQQRKLTKGTNIWLMYRPDATLDVLVRENRTAVNVTEVVADLSLPSASLCRALFETYLGSNSVIPDARKEWAKGARGLLESDNVRRDTRKGGSG